MKEPSAAVSRIVVDIEGLMCVIDELRRAGFEVQVPVVRDGVVATRRFEVGDELPTGYVSDQAPGSYDLIRGSDRSRFSWAVGPQAWKPSLHPAAVTTMTMTQPVDGSAVEVSVAPRPDRPFALFGMRPCDLAALDKLDRVLLDRPPSEEPIYSGRRRDAFLVVVNCGVPAGTCFCSSVDTGPHVDGRSASHDLEITELVGATTDTEPDYLIAAISDRGGDVLERVSQRVEARPVTERDDSRVSSLRDEATSAIERHMSHDRVAGALVGAHGSNRWEDIADTCVACGNCTSVCPTCFCTTINDVGDLTGTTVERHREWESCFSLEFSRLGGSTVRSSVASRYRQWMTHKLGSWHEQFGESGCVGCGRCSTWCPVGIDFVGVAQGFVDDLDRAGTGDRS